MLVHSQLDQEEIEVTVFKKGKDGWHSWSSPNVGFSRSISSHWQLSSGGQRSDPQTLEILRIPVVETRGLAWPVDYCLSGSMLSPTSTLWLRLIQAIVEQVWCLFRAAAACFSVAWCLLECILENPGARAALTSHCPKFGNWSHIFPPKLCFLPPCCSGSGKLLFQFNRGQTAQRRGPAISLWKQQHFDWQCDPQCEGERGGGSDRSLKCCLTFFQASMRKSRPR